MVDNWIVSKATNTPYQPYVVCISVCTYFFCLSSGFHVAICASSQVTRTNSPIAALPLGIYTINSSSTLSATAFPIPSHQSDNFGAVVGQLLGLFLMLAWAWPFSRLVRNLVEEKEARIKEGLKMMVSSHVLN
jgi:hypothetical protein